MKTFTWSFGTMRLTLAVPDELADKLERGNSLAPIDIDLTIHPGTEEQFAAALDALGGVSAVEPIRADAGFPHVATADRAADEESNLPEGEKQVTRAKATVWGPDETRPKVPAEDPMMAELRDRQKAEQLADEAA